jgi:hypothetical protein
MPATRKRTGRKHPTRRVPRPACNMNDGRAVGRPLRWPPGARNGVHALPSDCDEPKLRDLWRTTLDKQAKIDELESASTQLTPVRMSKVQ